MRINSTALSIAIANNMCAVTKEMYQQHVKACKQIEIEPIDGYKAYKTKGSLWIVVDWTKAFDEADNFNNRYGEENVLIHGLAEACVFEIKNQ